MSDKIVLGQIAGAFGVRGEVRLKSFCAVPDDITEYTPLTTPDGMEIATIVITGQTKGGFTARMDGITSKEQADALKGTDLLADRDRLPQLPDDEFYYADLIGLDVFDTGGAPLGRVKTVQNHGATDLLELIVPGASSTVLLPFTRDAVPTVDLTTRRIIANPPDGVLPDAT